MPDLPIILYEGVEDKGFLDALLEVLGIKNKFALHPDCGGKDKFKQLLDALVIPKHAAIIIVADNDGNPNEAFKNIQKQIGDSGFSIPTKPREIAITAGLSPVSVLMLPWDGEDGCLETLCLSAANPKYAAQLACADALVKCAGDGWPVSHKSKLRMRGFLSSICRSNPNTSLQYAWKTDNGRPGDIFPLKDVAVYQKISEYFKSFAP